MIYILARNMAYLWGTGEVPLGCSIRVVPGE